MDSSYKLQVKLGSAEFSAEGQEETVKQAFQKFLEAVKSSSDTKLFLEKTPDKETPEEISRGLLDKVFSVAGDFISLRLLPTDSPNKAADSGILLIYGFQKLLQLEEVPVTKLTQALTKSGVSFDRVDRILSVHKGLYMKGGTRSGGRYSLNNQGIQQAESWLKTWFR